MKEKGAEAVGFSCRLFRADYLDSGAVHLQAELPRLAEGQLELSASGIWVDLCQIELG